MTTFTASAGTGEPLPSGSDCSGEAINGGPWHLGNQNISWYRRPSHQGPDETINITVTHEDYTSLAITGIAHGCNTYGTGNIGKPTTGSKIEIWQLPEPSLPAGGNNEIRRVGSIELPTLDEEYARRRPYGPTDKWWTSFRLPVPGNLKQGPAELRLLAGTNPDGRDDYEVDKLVLTYCGIGIPALPGQGV